MQDVKKAAVIGYPIGQSLSPLIHKHWHKTCGIVGEYQKYAIPPDGLVTAVHGFINGGEFTPDGLIGFNVTTPHKEAIMPLLDHIAPMARQIGAVNTVKIQQGKTTGFNTDISGFKNQLETIVPDWPKDKPVLLLGAGGAARAAVMAFLSTSVPFIMVANRTREKAESLAHDMGQGRVTVLDWADRHQAVAGAGVVVNTTILGMELGMEGHKALDLDLSLADPHTVVYDIVYKPLETPLLKQAKELKLRTVDGLGMLVYQAAGAFKLWFDIDPAYDDTLKQKLLTRLNQA